MSPAEREMFLKHACTGDQNLEAEVRSLLLHHSQKTLLPEVFSHETRRDEHENSDTQRSVVSEPLSDGGQTHLVLADLWNENRELLRTRLSAFAWVVAGVIVFSIVSRIFKWAAWPPWFPTFHTICLVVDILCLIGLSQLWYPRLRRLRILELVIVLNTALLIVAIDVQETHQLASELPAVRQHGSATEVTSTNERAAVSEEAFLGPATLKTQLRIVRIGEANHYSWAILILVYGIFIPNTWQRAAVVTLPLAALPYAFDSVMDQVYPQIAAVLSNVDGSLPMPFVAAGIAVAAARFIHGSRLAAFRARRLSQYELIRETGKGGMGRVYEARHVMLKRPCAIKIIEPEKLSERNLAGFEREVRAASLLTHPNTIEIYDYGQTNEGLFFYVMELLPGMNLWQLVEETGPLPAERAVHFLVQICGALQEAHNHGIFHRDIKPANIFVTERGGIFDFAKLLDFGLVRVTHHDAEGQSKERTMTAGTPAYMSPEQIANFDGVDSRSDIYSLGAVGYFLLVGHPPFQGRSQAEVLLAHVNEPVKSPKQLRPDLSFEVSQVIEKCLAKSPDDRYQSAEELKLALTKCSLPQTWNQADAANWWRLHDEESRNDEEIRTAAATDQSS
jgi:serine/threonine-protein kinase